MEGLKPYQEYRDSGFIAIPEVPSHWGVERFGAIARLATKRNCDDIHREMLSLSAYRGIEIKQYVDKRLARHKEESLNYWVVEPGQLVVNPMWVIEGSIGVSRHHGIVSPAYRVYNLHGNVLPDYCDLLVRSHFYITEYNRYVRGPTTYDRSVRKNDFHQIPFLVPPITEQHAIINFLINKLAEIDRLIAARQRMVELLQELRTVIISRAVTRGLNPNVKLKPSGIEWLGEIPEHWEIIKLKYISHSLQTGPFGSQIHSGEYMPGGIPLINPSHLVNGQIKSDTQCAVNREAYFKLSRHILNEGDIVLARRGEMGRCALVSKSEAGWLCGSGSMRIRPNNSKIYSVLLQAIISTQSIKTRLQLESVGTTMDNLNATIVGNIPIPVPAIPEQEPIAENIKNVEKEYYRLVSQLTNIINFTQEYRATLISAVVTGKIDVRDSSSQGAI